LLTITHRSIKNNQVFHGFAPRRSGAKLTSKDKHILSRQIVADENLLGGRGLGYSCAGSASSRPRGSSDTHNNGNTRNDTRPEQAHASCQVV
jgi:hypothetical protein